MPFCCLGVGNPEDIDAERPHANGAQAGREDRPAHDSNQSRRQYLANRPSWAVKPKVKNRRNMNPSVYERSDAAVEISMRTPGVSGTVEKLSSGGRVGLSRWQVRFFISEGHYLKYYKNEESSEIDGTGVKAPPLAAIDLRQTVVDVKAVAVNAEFHVLSLHDASPRKREVIRLRSRNAEVIRLLAQRCEEVRDIVERERAGLVKRRTSASGEFIGVPREREGSKQFGGSSRSPYKVRSRELSES